MPKNFGLVDERLLLLFLQAGLVQAVEEGFNNNIDDVVRSDRLTSNENRPGKGLENDGGGEGPIEGRLIEERLQSVSVLSGCRFRGLFTIANSWSRPAGVGGSGFLTTF